MANYKLGINFTQDQLSTLYATGSNVIIAKPTGVSNPNVAWQVFKPMQTNTLSWTESYGIYASTTEVKNGAQLNQLSNVPDGAAMNQLYTLQPSAAISGPASGGAPNSFSLQNLYANQKFMTVGLFQGATVNGIDIKKNAISAVPTLLASTAQMTPYTTVYIWLQSQVKSNTVVTTVTSPMTKLEFGGGVNDITVKYDSKSGHFLNAGSDKAISALISSIEAAL